MTTRLTDVIFDKIKFTTDHDAIATKGQDQDQCQCHSFNTTEKTQPHTSNAITRRKDENYCIASRTGGQTCEFSKGLTVCLTVPDRAHQLSRATRNRSQLDVRQMCADRKATFAASRIRLTLIITLNFHNLETTATKKMEWFENGRLQVSRHFACCCQRM